MNKFHATDALDSVRYTKKRHQLLRDAASGKDWPGTDGTRRGLEKFGCMVWTGMPQAYCDRRVPQQVEVSHGLYWRITTKGLAILHSWEKTHSAF